MPLVVDASIALAFPLGEAHPGIVATLRRVLEDEWTVPSVWWFEVRNGLIVNERRGRLTEQMVGMALQELSQTAVTFDRSPDESIIMALARRHRLTFYDAAYLELALRERLALATLDRALAEAAQREGVEVLGSAA